MFIDNYSKPLVTKCIVHCLHYLYSNNSAKFLAGSVSFAKPKRRVINKQVKVSFIKNYIFKIRQVETKRPNPKMIEWNGK